MTWQGLANSHDFHDSLPGDMREVLNEVGANYDGQAGTMDRQEQDRLVEEMRSPFIVAEVVPNMCRTRAFALCSFILAEIIACAVNMHLHGKKIANSVSTINFFQVGFAVRSGLMQLPLDLFRNERDICARRLETAQVAVERAQHDAPCAVHVPLNDDGAIRDRLRAARLLRDKAVP